MVPNLKIKVDHSDRDISKIITVSTENCVSITVKQQSPLEDYEYYETRSFSKNDGFQKLITGEIHSKATEMLITAVNNRTKERDFFKLYCDMLDGTISEKEFDKILSDNESDYIVDENLEPNINDTKMALRLSKHIISVNTINDLSSLFSFNPDVLEEQALLTM